MLQEEAVGGRTVQLEIDGGKVCLARGWYPTGTVSVVQKVEASEWLIVS